MQDGSVKIVKDSMAPCFVVRRKRDGHELSFSGLSGTLVHFHKGDTIMDYGYVSNAARFLEIAAQFLGD